MLDLSSLNSEQREAVTRVDGPLMILAGAGTGKTRVITYRIAYMLGCGIDPQQIVALSFTNKAAREMSERASALVGPRAKKVWLGTFHSFCLSILRAHPGAAELTPGFGLAGTSDQIDLVRRGLEEKGWAGSYQADRLHYQIGIAKNQLLSPEDLRRPATPVPQGIEDAAVLADIYELYERQLKLHRVIDFDDCIYKTVRLLRENADVRGALRQKYRYLMVDEYQDTNAAQLAVLEQLASDTHDVCVVGDDDQSIYSWRGAMYEVLERFEELFPGTKLIKLEQNYRCSNVILDAANTVIRNNTRRKDKTLWSASVETTPIALVPCENDQIEARFVAEKCISLLGAGLNPSDIGVLYRANAQAKAIELALREARISYRTFGGQSFFERKEVKDFCCYLRLILDHDDRLALWRVINTPQRGIGLKTLERIEDSARAQRISPYQVLKEYGSLGGGRAEAACKNFVQIIENLAQRPRDTAEDFAALGVAILKESGLENDIRLKTEDGANRERKLQNLRSLPQWLASLATDVIAANDGTMDEQALLDILTLDADNRSESAHQRNYVSLMTIHAAKGLEFPAVFVIGVEEEQLPHKNSILDPAALCEERRLFYVALTRAKQKLFLSHCLERTSNYQGSRPCNPSRFIKELPAQTLAAARDLSLQQKKSEDERKSQTASRLNSLRASLGGLRGQ